MVVATSQMADQKASNRDEGFAAKILASRNVQTASSVLDVLLDYREELITAEQDGVTAMALYRLFQKEKKIEETCTYSSFTRAMTQFRHRVGLPLKKQGVREASRAKKAGRPLPSQAAVGSRPAPVNPPAAKPGERSVPLSTGAPLATARTLQNVAREKADNPPTE